VRRYSGGASKGRLNPVLHDPKLAEFLGTWAGDEQLLPTPWTAAGNARGKIVITEASSGGAFVDYTETQDGSTVLHGHGVVVGKGWWWFDSFGFVPTAPGAATWQDGSLVLERRSERGRTVMRLSLRDGVLHHEITTAVPADAELTQMLVGNYERE
jgi:hypothetical protein